MNDRKDVNELTNDLLVENQNLFKNTKRRNTKLIMHEGFFDFVCVSARKRAIRRNSLLQYHTLDIKQMSENDDGVISREEFSLFGQYLNGEYEKLQKEMGNELNQQNKSCQKIIHFSLSLSFCFFLVFD